MTSILQTTTSMKCIVSGSCPMCHRVLEHDCPFARIAIKIPARGGILSLNVGAKTYECPACPNPIEHQHRCI